VPYIVLFNLHSYVPFASFELNERNIPYSASRRLPILYDPNLRKCNNHLVSFIQVEGLFVPYIDDIFDTIKSRTMV